MKKIAIITAIIVTTGLTALAVSGNANKNDAMKLKADKAEMAVVSKKVNTLATAD